MSEDAGRAYRPCKSAAEASAGRSMRAGARSAEKTR